MFRVWCWFSGSRLVPGAGIYTCPPCNLQRATHTYNLQSVSWIELWTVEYIYLYLGRMIQKGAALLFLAFPFPFLLSVLFRGYSLFGFAAPLAPLSSLPPRRCGCLFVLRLRLVPFAFAAAALPPSARRSKC
jgi:hypothetical protein